MTTKATGRKRLAKLADFLDTQVPRRRFDMSVWARAKRAFVLNSKDEPVVTPARECGTSACALGWATAVFPQHLALRNATNQQRAWVRGTAVVGREFNEEDLNALAAVLADSERLAEVEKAVSRVDLVEAVPESSGWWQVWWPHDADRQSGTKLEGVLSLTAAETYARGFRAGAKAVLRRRIR